MKMPILYAVALAGTAALGFVLLAQPAAAPPPYTTAAQFYSGVSGPGRAVTGTGYGGYQSGRQGVFYSGEGAKPGWHPLKPEAFSGSAVTAGLLPPLRPIWDIHLRDTIIRIGGDGEYYMTGSPGDNIWDRNDGVELWRSHDLKDWSYLGLVWTFEKDASAWQKVWGKTRDLPVRAVWAPEIHYIDKKYFITLSFAGGAGTAVLVSRSGKPEGPYVNAFKPDVRATGGIDATLFQDDDGKVYFTQGRGGTIYRMKDDFSGFTDEGRRVEIEKPADGSWTRDEVANEGASNFKHGGKYYLTGAGFYKGRYSSVAVISDRIYGPYKQWHEAVPGGGGGNYFRDKDGRWWCTVFGNDDQMPWREKPGMVRIEFAEDGRIQVARDQPDFVLQESARQKLP
jgi:hypothetical protein